MTIFKALQIADCFASGAPVGMDDAREALAALAAAYRHVTIDVPTHHQVSTTIVLTVPSANTTFRSPSAVST